MGQAFSSGNAIQVILPKSSYQSGEQVAGFVVLSCTSPFDCSQVLLRVTGTTLVSWDETETVSVQENDEWKEEQKTSVRSISEEFLKVTVPIHTFSSNCLPGQYQMPFSFTLPSSLPASFTYRDNYTVSGVYTFSNTLATIEYKVTAECVTGSILPTSLHHSQSLIVRQDPSKVDSAGSCVEVSATVSSCCCGGGSGSIWGKIQLANAAVAAGDTLQVTLEIDNQSSSNVDAVKVVVERLVLLKANTGLQEIKTDVAMQEFPGVPSGSSLRGDKALQLSLRLPTDLAPSTQSSNITCSYAVLVKLNCGVLASVSKQLRAPITVYAQDPEHIAYTQAPDYWKPTSIAEPVNLVLPSAPPLPPGQVAGMTANPLSPH